MAIGCLALASCGPAIGDGAERIGNSPYQLVWTDSRSAWIFPTAQCSRHCPSIQRHVVKLAHNDRAIAVRRQMVVDYRCGEGGVLRADYPQRFRQYVIDLSSNELLGPFTVAQYEAFMARKPELARGLELLGPSDRFDGSEGPDPARTCAEPG